MQKYLPLLNLQINKYLQMMDFYINFTLDEEFNENVKTPIHEDFSYGSFSEGEKQKIGLARTFVRNSKILLLDEPTNSLDYSSKEFLCDIVKKESEHKIILMITHESQFDDIANGIWYV
jgi:ABC-type multidrug transport system ATPase subunit